MSVRANLKLKLVAQFVGSCLVLMLAIGMTGCEKSTATVVDKAPNALSSNALVTTDGPLSEVNVPPSIAGLAPSLAKFQPQVEILSPQMDQVLTDDRVTVKLQVKNLPIFKSKELGLGNHLHVILDKQTYQGVYDLAQPLVFKNLAAGTHTLRVFASRAWHESFKNSGAYAQITFHVLTKTSENNPNPRQPLLTYSRPTGTYGAEPIMLDYYLTNAPSHLVEGSSVSLPDWKIRATVNSQQFTIDRWAPVYLQGFKQGKNWVRLELVDDRGTPIPNVYNDTVSIITYDPQSQDTLAKLTKGELNPDFARSLVDPNYVVVKPTPAPIPVIVSAPKSITPPQPLPTPAPVIQTAPIPSPIVVAPLPPTAIPVPAIPSTTPVILTPAPIAQPPITPSPIVVTPLPLAKVEPTPTETPKSPELPSPPAIAIPAPIPAPMPTPVAKIVQPQVLPSPAPKPIETVPETVPVIRSTPIATPASPEPIALATPVLIQPPFIPATSIPAPVIKPSPPAQITPVIQPPAVTNPPVQAQEQQTWQDQAIKLIQAAGVKTRAFTQTIPGKSQRFAHNVQVWWGNAIDTIQSWGNP